MKKKNNKDYLQMIPSIILVMILIGIIFENSVASKRTIDSQAMEYLDQASDRTAEELEKTFVRQEECMHTMAHMTAHIMKYERIDTKKLIRLTENSPFDGIEYIHPNGSCYGMNEQSWNIEDKEYFKDAVQQHTGYAFDNAPERSEERCIVFYAPIVSDNADFYGILVGYLREETIKNMLDVSFWGHTSVQYLCTSDGTIIATNYQEESCANIQDIHKKCGYMTEKERKNLAALIKTKSGNFQYTHNGNTELGSISALDDGNLLFVETFPPEVLTELTASAQNKMHLAVAAVILTLSAYGISIFMINRKSKLRLEAENNKVNELLKGVEGLANHDELTGLYNRRGMNEIINSRNIERRQRAFLILDIDYFKQINDTFGHQTGDKLLVKVAGLLKEVFRAEDIIIRMGGDEFAVILPNFKLEQTEIVKKKIKTINELLQNPTDQLPASSISVGVAFSKANEKDELFIRADKALYKMKENGRCGCCVYEEMFLE